MYSVVWKKKILKGKVFIVVVYIFCKILWVFVKILVRVEKLIILSWMK